MQRLCGNLQVDISKACSLLGWVPPVSVDEGGCGGRSWFDSRRGPQKNWRVSVPLLCGIAFVTRQNL